MNQKKNVIEKYPDSSGEPKTNSSSKGQGTNSLLFLFRLLNRVLQKNRISFAILVFLMLIDTLTMVASGVALQILVDRVLLPAMQQTQPSLSPLYQTLTVLGLVFLVGIVSAIVGTQLLTAMSHRILKRFRDQLFQHMETLPISYFDQHPQGEVMSLYTNDVDTLRQLVTASLPNTVVALIQILATLIAMIVLSPLLSIFALILLLLQTFVFARRGARIGKAFQRQQKDLADITAYIQEQFHGHADIQLHNHVEESIAQFASRNESLGTSSASAMYFAGSIRPFIANLGNLFFVLIAVVGGTLVVNGWAGVTLGALTAYLQYTRSFSQPFLAIAEQINGVSLAVAGGERLFALLDTPSEEDQGRTRLVCVQPEADGSLQIASEPTGHWAWQRPSSKGKPGELIPLRGSIRLEGVDFGYTEEQEVLKNLSFYAEPGQKVAFVGSTGAGKTTIANLLNRFYDIRAGRITYDGEEISTLAKSDLRHAVGIVLQETNLFTGTIADNIRFGKLDATEEEIERAAHQAYAHSFIQMLPQGYNTHIGADGEELSQGQRQLLAIARAAIANPPVLVLDEATANIDTRTERLVQKAMDNLMRGRTVFVIAHRLSTIRNADVILVLDQGQIVERGSHEDLLEQKGLYWELYTGQRTLA